jgi:hypothetical protein
MGIVHRKSPRAARVRRVASVWRRGRLAGSTMVRMAVALALSLVVSTAQQNLTGDRSAEASVNAARIRSHLLAKADWDRLVPPLSVREVNYSAAGTDVSIYLNFFKVKGIKVSDSTMQLQVWLAYRWNDSRLSWNASAFGDLETVFFQGEAYSGAEVRSSRGRATD